MESIGGHGNQKGHRTNLEEVTHYGHSFIPEPLLSLSLPPVYSEVSHCGPHVPLAMMLCPETTKANGHGPKPLNPRAKITLPPLSLWAFCPSDERWGFLPGLSPG